ncbi:hypothetical protein [Streptomyces sp. VRA16 Mangrove soil]|uniref:hypothetical protein n=1 Tax=Streptomyces sp. VRA16 Mangrove soil TaxID=2817434 RepID=UPI001A9F2E4F|nr:hypothetical protein [Streptomyces sp. VRA16 Mangrove soil]MBO1336691.1 hypothetical protein [Streptomyces sp. VRA16 Mangrove soil]
MATETEYVIRVFGGDHHDARDPFVSLRVGDGQDMDIVFIVDVDAAESLRGLAQAANAAADLLADRSAAVADV